MTQHIGTQMSLFDRLGGAPAITAAAGLFCNQVLADPLLAPYSDDDDMDRQVAKRAAFLVMSPGGPYRRSRRTSSCGCHLRLSGRPGLVPPATAAGPGMGRSTSAGARTQAETSRRAGTKRQAETSTKAGTSTKAETKRQAGTSTKAETKRQAGTSTKAGTKRQAGAEWSTGTCPGAGTSTRSGPGPEAEPAPGLRAGTGRAARPGPPPAMPAPTAPSPPRC
jgi:hypothetical protein